MGAMKSLLADDNRSDLLTLCNGIARARDEYRDDLYRERDLTKDLLWALKQCLDRLERVESGKPAGSFAAMEFARTVIAKAEGR